MIALDTDVLTDLMRGREDYVARIGAIHKDQRRVPVVVVEEIMRGRLNAIRQAESGRSKADLESAYKYFEQTFADFVDLPLMSFTSEAERQSKAWRSQGIRVGTRDLRIAAIAVAHHAKLVTRNRRHFDDLPGLDVEFWD